MRAINHQTRTMILREMFYFFALILFLGSTSLLVAFSAPMPLSHAEYNKPVPADNSKVNARDTKGTTLTPQDQYRGSAADVETTRKIRESLTRDNSLSANAKNIKIITLKGVTTLRGPVNSIEESLFIERIAKNVNGYRIKNSLEVLNR
jgi:hyperosmotically inducible periplasmic protein